MRENQEKAPFPHRQITPGLALLSSITFFTLPCERERAGCSSLATSLSLSLGWGSYIPRRLNRSNPRFFFIPSHSAIAAYDPLADGPGLRHRYSCISRRCPVARPKRSRRVSNLRLGFARTAPSYGLLPPPLRGISPLSAYSKQGSLDVAENSSRGSCPVTAPAPAGSYSPRSQTTS